jgi:hypothetical protein
MKLYAISPPKESGLTRKGGFWKPHIPTTEWSYTGVVLSRSAVLVLLLLFTAAPLPSAQPSFAISRPTVIAFFPHVTQKELEHDPDRNESLADFQLYVKQARERLAKMGIDLKEVYASSFRINVGGKIATFRAGALVVGYYFIAPGKKPRIEYAVETDSDLVQLSTDYFGIPSSEDDESARRSLRAFLEGFDRDLKGRFTYALVDLNGDGKPEAVVYLMGNDWCGSGGCTTLILVRDGDSWRLLTKVAISRPPIRVLVTKSNGWRSIGVWVQGGGIQPGYEAELRFDGKTYPANPSTLSARPVTGTPDGETLIAAPPGR